MNGGRLVLCCVIVWRLSLGPDAEASPCSRNDAGDNEESKRNGSKQVIDEDFIRSTSRASTGLLERITGLKVNYDNSELIVRYSPYGERDNYSPLFGLMDSRCFLFRCLLAMCAYILYIVRG